MSDNSYKRGFDLAFSTLLYCRFFFDFQVLFAENEENETTVLDTKTKWAYKYKDLSNQFRFFVAAVK